MALSVAAAGTPWAANPLPGGAELQRLRDVMGEGLIMHGVASRPLVQEETSSTTPPLTSGPTFLLTGVEVTGEAHLAPQVVQTAFAGLVGQEVTIGDLQAAIADINAAYRKQGVLLVRAYMPPQQLDKNGAILKLAVATGRIGKVEVEGRAGSGYAAKTLARMEKKLQAQTAPASTLENTLLRLNDLPGTTARATLKAGEEAGTSDVVVHLDNTPWEVGAGFNNDGTQYLGPNQLQLEATLNNPLLGQVGWQDKLTARLVQTPRLRELTYAAMAYELPLNTRGLSLEVGGDIGISRPGWVLEDLDTESKVYGMHATLTQNLRRRAGLSVDTFVGLDWEDSYSTVLGNHLTTDHLRELALGLRAWGQNDIGGRFNHRLAVINGLDVFNATERGNLGASRLRGTGHGYTRVTLDSQFWQPLGEYWSLLLQGSGQFSSHALLSGAEFALGGERYGRGYDTGELSGDMGLGGRSELQLTFRPGFSWVPWYQMFGFYDGGVVWNKDRGPQAPDEETMFSIGAGLRMPIKNNLQLEVVAAKPTTKQVASTGQDNPKIYVRLKGRLEGDAE